MKSLDRIIDETPIIDIDMSYVGPISGWSPVPSPDKLRQLCEAAQQHEENKVEKRPRPPRGKAIKLGAVAIESGLG